MEQIDIDINVNMNNVDEVDELTNRLQSANEEVERLEDALSEAHLNGDDIEADIITDELAGATAEADSLQGELDNISNTTINPEINIDNSGIDETNDKIQETESSASSLGTALSGLAGMIGVDQMISTADNIEMSWNRLELTFGNVSQSLKNNISSAVDATGRSGGQVRSYFNQMGIAGIKNGELLESSFKSMAAAAVQLDVPLESVQGAMQRMVMTGNVSGRTLRNLGLTADDLGRAMGVSGEEAKSAFEALDQEGRLQALTTAMGDGTQANEMYKHSYAGLKAQAENAMAGLMGAIGEGVLPVINPMIEGATNVVKGLTDAFKSLPGPVKGVVGSFGGFLAVGTTTVGTLGLLGKAGSGVVDGLKSIKSGYDSVKSAMGTAKLMMDALRNSESITQGVRAALAIATGAEATAETAGAAAKTAATGPTTGLAVAENSLLLPLLLIVGAVIAVIAVMWYLYNTNETVRNGINWLVAQIQGFINTLVVVVTAIATFVSQGAANINRLPGIIWNAFLRVLSYVTSWATGFIQRGVHAATNFVNRVRGAISGIGGAISGALSGVYNAITAPFQRAYNFIYNNIIKPLQDAWNWLGGTFGNYEGYGTFEGYSGVNDTLNNLINTSTSNTSNSMIVNNNFNGLIEESAADYIVNAVNDRLRKEKLLRGV